MTTKNGVPFRQMMLPASKYSLKAPYAMTPRKITIHNTDNQMPARNEISYMIGNSSVVGFHIGIDEVEAIQGVPFYRNTFHAGDGKNGYGNRNTIGVEMCRNYDRSRGTTNLHDPLRSQFEKTLQNTIKVVAQLCIELNIVPSFSTIKQHKDWSGKHCPSKILNDKRWNELVNGIVAEYGRLKGLPIHAAKPSTVTKPTPKPSAPSGNSIVDYLNAKGQDSSLAARKKLADQYGIKGYKGTAAQNTALLDKLKSGSKPTPKPSAPSGVSVVDYLNKQGKGSSFSARKRLATQYGIRNYTGTAAQNTELLEKLQAGSSPSKKIKTNSLVDYLKLTKQPSDFASRKKLAEKHGIRNYKGTAAQNKKLLDILNK